MSDYKDFMIFTRYTDRNRGRLYRCPKCGKRYWSAWGWARRHFEEEKLNDSAYEG